VTTPSGEPIFPRLRPDEEPRRRPSTAVIATSALALILVIILALVLVTRNTGASKDDLVKAAQQATDQAQAAQDAKDQKAAADKAVAAADKAAADAKTAADAVTAKAQADATAAAAKAASDAAAAAAAAKAAADAATTRPYQYLYGYPYYSTAPSAGVWGYFPLVTTDPNAITPSIHTGPHVANTVLGRVSPTGTVAVVCSVSGDFVDPVHWPSTSDWDYITSPLSGWVSDALINTNGATAPRC